MKYLYTAISFFLGFNLLIAQQINSSLGFITNPAQNMPTMVGIRTSSSTAKTKIFLNHRSQWVKIKDAPQMLNLAGDVALPKENRVGLGLSIDATRYNIFSSLHLKSTYAYHVDLGRDNYLNFGLGIGYLRHRIDLSRTNPSNPADQLLSQYPNSLSRFTSDFGIGYLRNSENFFLSIDAALINQPIGWAKFHEENNNLAFFRQNATFSFVLRTEFMRKNEIVSLSPMIRFNIQPIKKYNISQTDILWCVDFKTAKNSNEVMPAKIKVGLGTSIAFNKTDDKILNNGFTSPIVAFLGIELFERGSLSFGYQNTSSANKLGVGESFDLQLGYSF